jgi:hypothetical protein
MMHEHFKLSVGEREKREGEGEGERERERERPAIKRVSTENLSTNQNQSW